MGLAINSGPSITTGNIDSAQNRVPEQGPSLQFQGDGLIDPRLVGTIGAAPGRPVYGFYANSYLAMIDAVPQAAAATRIAAAQAATGATALTLVSAQGAGVSCNMPLVPFGKSYMASNVVTPAVTLDFGFTTGTVASGTAQITSLPSGAWKYFQKGQKIAISGAGTASNLPLITTVTATPAANATTVSIADAPGQSASGLQIGNVDPSGTAMWPYVLGGAVALADPAQSLARGVSVTTTTGSGTVTVVGYDLFGQPMSETITVVNAGIGYGKKAFKSIVSVTPSASGTGMSIGTSDVFGFTCRSDLWEYMNVFWAGAFLTASTGWTVADGTSPATTTTGDVRGTMQLGVVGGGSGATGSTDGTKRLAAFMSLPIYNAIGATNLNYQTMFGTTQT